MKLFLEIVRHDFLKEFGVTLQFAFCENERTSGDALFPKERLLLENSHSQYSFLMGRAALKKLCYQQDTSFITFPNVHYSLTHTHSHAIAVFCETSLLFQGVGIDLETVRPLNVLHASYFLNAAEMNIYAPFTPSKLTALWTVKEAVFKADIGSQEKDFKKYHIDFDQQCVNKAGSAFIFKTYVHDEFYFSISLKRSNL